MSAVPAGVFAAENRTVQLGRNHLAISAVLRHKYGKRAERVEGCAVPVDHVVIPRFCIIAVIVHELMVDKSTNGVSFLSDRIWRALVVESDEMKTPSGNVSIVSNGDELLVEVLLSGVEGVDFRDSCRCVSRCAPFLNSYM